VLQIVAMTDQASEARPVTELLKNLELASIDAFVPRTPPPNDDDVQPPLSDDDVQPPPNDDDVLPPPTPTAPASTGATLLASAVWGGLTAPIGPLHGDPCAFPGACAYSAGVCMPDDTHPGVDVAIEIGTPLYAPTAATVEFAGADRFYAPYHVDLRTADGDLFIFGHMWSVDPAVVVGGRVEAGQFLGASGSPTSFGSMDPIDSGHIHFEARRANGCAFDPLPLLSGESDPTLASGLAALIRPDVRQ
jgi:murein DD-endopeptidase MepM/ murein hydrolase activator NlpD